MFTILRKKGHLSSSYIDDCYLQGESYDECYDNVQDTVLLLQELGFPIHDEKSVLIPSQILTFLGFVLNSVTMTVQLTANRKEKLKNSCLKLVSKDQCTIQNLAEVIGLIVSSLPGVEYGPLHYRTLERDKTYALREHKGNFGASMTLSQSSKAELNWWIVNVDTSSQLISRGEPELLIDGILVVPLWTSQSWYPKLLRLLVDPPLVISHRETLLTLPGCPTLHPLRKKLNLLACHLCGESTRTKAFLKKQPILSYNPDASLPRSSTMYTSRNGFSSVLKGRLIQFVQI